MAIVRARLGRYAQWQLRDYVIGPGGITIGFVLLLIWITSQAVNLSTHGGTPSVPPLDWLVHALALLGSIFATSSLISEDRSRGYYRFFFAKPLDPLRYYAQAFVLRGLVLIVVAVFVAGMARVIGSPPLPILGTVAYTAISYVLIGGITVAQSTVWRFAWVGSFVMFLASAPIAALAMPGTPIGAFWRFFWRVLHWLLPPFSQEEVLHQMLRSAPDWSAMGGSILWCIGYGLLALMATALVIRGREWAR